jgi:hypothetical protein
MMEIRNFKYLKIETYCPKENLEALVRAFCEAGAGKVGNYDHAYATSQVMGHWRPLPGSNPAIGTIGEIESQEEIKIEFICAAELVQPVIQAMKLAHPYETPIINVIPMFSFHIEEQ